MSKQLTESIVFRYTGDIVLKRFQYALERTGRIEDGGRNEVSDESTC